MTSGIPGFHVIAHFLRAARATTTVVYSPPQKPGLSSMLHLFISSTHPYQTSGSFHLLPPKIWSINPRPVPYITRGDSLFLKNFLGFFSRFFASLSLSSWGYLSINVTRSRLLPSPLDIKFSIVHLWSLHFPGHTSASVCNYTTNGFRLIVDRIDRRCAGPPGNSFHHALTDRSSALVAVSPLSSPWPLSLPASPPVAE